MRKRNSFLIGVLCAALAIPATARAESVTLSVGDGITLQYPITLEDAVIYRDGGTIGLDLKDAIGAHLFLSLDGQLSTPTHRRCLYVGALHPSVEGALRIPRHSPAEERILAMLLDWKNWQTPEQLKDPKAELVLRVIAYLQENAK